MNIPSKIKLGGHTIKVKRSPASEIDSAGEYNIFHQLIRIMKDPDIPQDRADEAFQHEIFEAIKYINDLDIGHKDLTVLSEVFFQVVRDNKLRFF